VHLQFISTKQILPQNPQMVFRCGAGAENLLPLVGTEENIRILVGFSHSFPNVITIVSLSADLRRYS
jgi:hypothetical protein